MKSKNCFISSTTPLLSVSEDQFRHHIAALFGAVIKTLGLLIIDQNVMKAAWKNEFNSCFYGDICTLDLWTYIEA